MGKKALLVLSFGTSFEEALPAIVNIEETCKKAFPDYDFYRAFTSGMIIRKWARTKNVIIHKNKRITLPMGSKNTQNAESAAIMDPVDLYYDTPDYCSICPACT